MVAQNPKLRWLGKPTTPKQGLAQVAPYAAATSGVANLGGIGTDTSFEYLTRLHHYRIRQSGTIKQVKLYMASLTGISAFYVKVWRKNNAGTYDLVGSSEDISASLVAAGTATITLASPIVGVQEGDYYGYRIEWSTGAQNFHALTGLTTTSNASTNADLITYSVANTAVATAAYSWETQTANSGVAVPIELYMDPPMLVGIGDSYMAGGPLNYGYLRDYYSAPNTASISDPEKGWLFHLCRDLNWTYQNMGYGGQAASAIAARFAVDAVALSPRFVVINAFTNDILASATDASAIAGTFMPMVATAIANDIVPIVLLIPPATVLTTTQHVTRREFNRILANACSAYQECIIVDLDDAMGAFKTGGPEENKDDTASAYSLAVTSTTYASDTTHFNFAGIKAMASVVKNAIASARGAY